MFRYSFQRPCRILTCFAKAGLDFFDMVRRRVRISLFCSPVSFLPREESCCNLSTACVGLSILSFLKTKETLGDVNTTKPYTGGAKGIFFSASLTAAACLSF